MLKKFIVNTNSTQNWLKVIVWWESRRLLYNFLLIAFGIFSMVISSPFLKNLLPLFPPPVFFLWNILLFLFWANVFYTSGWIFQLITYRSSNKLINCIKPKIFVWGVLFSFGIQLIPLISAGIYTIITGGTIESRDPEYTTTKIQFSEIVGEYKLEAFCKMQLDFPDSLSNKTIIRFNADSTFVLKNYPFHFFSPTIKDYQIINAKGKWKIEKYFNNYWVIPMTFEQTQIIGSDYIEHTKIHYFYSFRVNKKIPPYEIYVVCHPFFNIGVHLQRL